MYGVAEQHPRSASDGEAKSICEFFRSNTVANCSSDDEDGKLSKDEPEREPTPLTCQRFVPDDQNPRGQKRMKHSATHNPIGDRYKSRSAWRFRDSSSYEIDHRYKRRAESYRCSEASGQSQPTPLFN